MRCFVFQHLDLPKTPVLGFLGLETSHLRSMDISIDGWMDQGLQGDFMWHQCFVSQHFVNDPPTKHERFDVSQDLRGSPKGHQCFVSQRFVEVSSEVRIFSPIVI